MSHPFPLPCKTRALLLTLCFCILIHPALASLLRHESAVRDYSQLISENRHLQDGTWTTITYDDFEGGLGTFKAGGGDVSRASGKEANYAHQGSASLRLRDNSGVASSAFHTLSYNVMPYSALRVSFWFYPYSMENGEDFWLQYSHDNGSSWKTVKSYVRGTDFENGRFYESSIDLKGPSYVLQTTTAKIRFMCDASDDGDRIYIDEVRFQGFIPATRADICPLDRLNPPQKYSISPYIDTIPGDRVEDDLNEISYIAFSEQMDSNGARYAYVASDKEQFSLKVLKFTENGLGQHFNGIGTVVATYRLNLADYSNDDWEAMSLGPCTDSDVDSAYSVSDTCIYIGNFGNNLRPSPSTYVQRQVLKIFKFKEPVINAASPRSLAVDVATIRYQYGSGFTLTYKDAETMFVDWVGVEGSTTEKKGDIYVVTKAGSSSCDGGVGKIPVSWHRKVSPGATTAVYNMAAVLSKPPSQGQGASCSDGPFREWTGGDMRRDGRLIAMIREGPPASVYFYPRLASESVAVALSNLPCPYVSSTSYGLPNEKKHEAVAFADAGGTKIADISECEASCSPSLYLYKLDNPGSINQRIDEPTTGWVPVTYEDFEGGGFPLSDYTSGGSKAVVISATTCGSVSNCDCSGSNAVVMSNGRGLESSFSSSTNVACNAYTLLRITFQFKFVGYDHLDTLFAEISVDGGTNYFIVGDWALDVVDWAEGNVEYVNNVCTVGSVVVSPEQLRVSSFGDQVRLRFRNGANSDNDQTYVDKISVEGYPVAASIEVPFQWPSDAPSFSPNSPHTSFPDLPFSLPSSIPSPSLPAAPLTRDDLCPLDRLNPPKKYSVNPYVDTGTSDIVEDDLNEISYIVFSEQVDKYGARYAYVASDKEQFSLKVLKFTDNVFGQHFNGKGTVVATYTLSLADYSNDDWEDISLGPCTDSDVDSAYSVSDTCIYIGNFGNTNERVNPSPYVPRDVVKIFKFKEPVISTASPQSLTVDVATIQFQYGSGFTLSINDAETMFVDWVGVEGSTAESKGDIYIVTTGGCNGGVGKIPVSWHKNVSAGATTAVYDMAAVLSKPPSQGQGASCSDGPFREWTGGDMRRDGRLIVMIRAGPPASVYFYPRLATESVADALSNLPCPYVSSTSYGLSNEKKHEAVAFMGADGTKIADISECQGSCSPLVYFYTLDYPGSINQRVEEPADLNGWVLITSDDFEGGNFASSGYISGGSKASVSASTSCGGTCACSGSNAVELFAGSGVKSSFSSSANLPCNSYSLLKVTFQFKFDGFDHLDTLFAEISVDGGSTYFIVGDWAGDVVDWAANNATYVNRVCATGHVLVEPMMLRVFSFGDQVRLRFRNSANADNDKAYVDDVRLEGYSGTMI